MLPPDAVGEGNSRGLTRTASHVDESPRGLASMDEVSPAEIMNLPPYERWLVTLPDDSPELFGQPDPRVGKAPPDTQPNMRIASKNMNDTLVGGAENDRLDQPGWSQATDHWGNVVDMMNRHQPAAGSGWWSRKPEQIYPGYDPRWFAESGHVFPPNRRARLDVEANNEMDRVRGGPWGGRPMPFEFRQKILELARDQEAGRLPGDDLNRRRQDIRDDAFALSKKPHWRDEFSDGCSAPGFLFYVPEFAGACARHDRDYYEAAKSREHADKDFYRNLLGIAEQQPTLRRRQQLKDAAYAHYLGVRVSGGAYYSKP